MQCSLSIQILSNCIMLFCKCRHSIRLKWTREMASLGPKQWWLLPQSSRCLVSIRPCHLKLDIRPNLHTDKLMGIPQLDTPRLLTPRRLATPPQGTRLLATLRLLAIPNKWQIVQYEDCECFGSFENVRWILDKFFVFFLMPKILSFLSDIIYMWYNLYRLCV